MGGGHILTQEAPLETSKTRNLLEDPRLGQHVASLPEKNKKNRKPSGVSQVSFYLEGSPNGGGGAWGVRDSPPFFGFLFGVHLPVLPNCSFTTTRPSSRYCSFRRIGVGRSVEKPLALASSPLVGFVAKEPANETPNPSRSEKDECGLHGAFTCQTQTNARLRRTTLARPIGSVQFMRST